MLPSTSMNSQDGIGKEISALSTPLEFLEDLFPLHSKEDICKILAYNHYDLYQTLDDLIEDDDYEYDYDENGNVIDRLVNNNNINNSNSSGNSNNNSTVSNTIPICKYYVNGICNNNNCPFLHTTTDGKSPTIAPICKFFLNEGCFITNCPYRHSSETVLCKFWMIGSCIKGNDCIYSHQLANTIELYDQNKKSSTNGPLININKEIPKAKPDIESFPSLSNNSSKTKPQTTNNTIHNTQFSIKSNKKPQTVSAKPTPINNKPSKAIENHESFPSLSSSKNVPKKKKHSTQTQPSFEENDMSYIVKIKQLEDSFKHISLEDIKREFNQTKDIRQATMALTEKFGAPRIQPQVISSNPSQQPSFRTQTPTPKGNITWVGTGSELNHLYSKHRDEAIQHGRERNLCFNLAAKAFLAGDPASAKRLSERGHYHDKIMKDLHAKAMELIFKERNMNFDSDTLDLHGLHVKEAIEIIEDRLSYNENSLPLYIIIGVGHHSGHMARLPIKVKEYITNRGLRYKDCSHDKREGLIMVYK